MPIKEKIADKVTDTMVSNLTNKALQEKLEKFLKDFIQFKTETNVKFELQNEEIANLKKENATLKEKYSIEK